MARHFDPLDATHIYLISFLFSLLRMSLHALHVDDVAARALLRKALPKVTQYWTELGQNLQLFERYRTLAQAPEFAGLSAARRRIVEKSLTIAGRLIRPPS